MGSHSIKRRAAVGFISSQAADTAIFTAFSPSFFEAGIRVHINLSAATVVNLVFTDGATIKKTPLNNGAAVPAYGYTQDFPAPRYFADDTDLSNALTYTVEVTGGTPDVNMLVCDELMETP